MKTVGDQEMEEIERNAYMDFSARDIFIHDGQIFFRDEWASSVDEPLRLNLKKAGDYYYRPATKIEMKLWETMKDLKKELDLEILMAGELME